MNNKNKKLPQNLILLLIIVVSSLIVTILGLVISNGEGMPIEKLMLFIRDGFKFEDSETLDDEYFEDTDDDFTVEPDDTTMNPDDTIDPSDGENEGEDTFDDTPESETPVEVLTPEEYFSKTLFIGDSRTVGLANYGKIENASYFARTSMSVFNCFADKKSETGTGNLNLEEYLKKNSFERIYILLGINEIGSSAKTITSGYKKIIDRIHSIQPDAVIVIQSNMHVTKKKSDANPKTFNNSRIDNLNESLSQLADNEKIFYIGFESIFDDSTGNLNAEYTGDGVHLKGKYYKLWKDYLLTEGMVYPTKKPQAVTTRPIETTSNNTTSITTTPDETEKEDTPPQTTAAAPEVTTEPEETTKKETTDKQTDKTPDETTSTEDTTVIEETTAPPVLPTDEDREYFKDALFIGDSRTHGFYLYSRISEAKYFARTSMSAANAFDDKKSETGTGNLNLEEYLTQNSFGKIYILLGINEIGYSYSWIISRYTTLIEKIQSLQPNAKIIIQSNMHVTKAKSDAYPNSFNNDRIDTLNKKLSALADGERVFYLDFASIFDTPQGDLKAEYSRDGIHFYKSVYNIWRDWILVNGKV